MTHLTKKDIKKKIKDSGVSYNGTLFSEFERKGKLKLPENFVKFRQNNHGPSVEDIRIYTPEEVEQIANTYIRLKKEYDETPKDQR